METIRTYLLGIVAAAMGLAALLQLLRRDAIKKAVALAGGLLLALAVLTPLLRADLDAFAEYLSRAQMEAEASATGIEIANRELLARIIQEKTEAYILDKAAELGADVTVDVTMEQEGEYPYPVAAEIRGALTEIQRSALSLYLEEAIGIPGERQAFLREGEQ